MLIDERLGFIGNFVLVVKLCNVLLLGDINVDCVFDIWDVVFIMVYSLV